MTILLILLTIVLWGAGSFLGKTALKNASSIYVYFLEATGTLTIAFLACLFFQKELISVFRSFSWAGYLFGVLWGVGTVTFIIALKYKPATSVVPLTALYPLVAVILAIIFLKETITLKIGVGIILAVLAGILLS